MEAGGDLPRIITEETILAHCYGRLSASTEQGRQLSAGEWVSLPFDEAIKFFRAKKLMTPTRFKAMSDSKKREAFAIAGVTQKYALQQSSDMIAKALEEGTEQRKVVKDLGKAFDAWGLTPASSHHLDVVFRNGVLGAMQEGRHAQLKRATATRPYWRYRTVGDDRVRDAHAAQDGKVFEASHPFWSTWHPPNGHQCRCNIESLSKRDIEREGLKVETDAPRDHRPDPGWEGSPTTAGAASKAADKVKREVAASKALQPPKLSMGGGSLHSSSGDLGTASAAAKAAKVDALAGLSPSAASDLASQGPFFVRSAQAKLASGSTEVQIPFASQYADSLAMAASRIASNPATAKATRVGKTTVQATYRTGASTGAPELVSHGGLVRGTEAVISATARDAEAIERLAEIALQTQAGTHGAIRRASKVSSAIIRGAKAAPKGFKEAFLCTRRLGGGRVEMRLSRSELVGFKSEKVFVTEAKHAELK